MVALRTYMAVIQVLFGRRGQVASICGSGCATIGMGAAMHAPHGPSEPLGACFKRETSRKRP